jgi:hypothetical protein
MPRMQSPEVPLLANAGFYEAAAGLSAILLLSGGVAEVRAARDGIDACGVHDLDRVQWSAG